MSVMITDWGGIRRHGSGRYPEMNDHIKGMKLDPTSLQLFVSVVEEGTIAAAGEKEHIAPAAISKRIADLEELLGSDLLRRSNKGVEPTPAGAALVNIARRILHDLDDAYHQIREYASGVRGTVRVFANISSITQFLPEAFTVFMKEHPTVRLELQSTTARPSSRRSMKTSRMSASSPRGIRAPIWKPSHTAMTSSWSSCPRGTR